jgi:hypothetical protein
VVRSNENQVSDHPKVHGACEGEPFGELVAFTLTGYIGGLLLAWTLDSYGLHQNALGQGAVRTLAGEGESIMEGVFALRRRAAGKAGSLAEAYAWGKVLGMVLPWIVDAGSRLVGIDVNAPEGFYVPYLYAMGDQFGAAILGFVFLRNLTGTTWAAARSFLRSPVMLATLSVLVVVPVGLLVVRLLGFSPTNQILTALEVMAANLCWVPPVVGWFVGDRCHEYANKE